MVRMRICVFAIIIFSIFTFVSGDNIGQDISPEIKALEALGIFDEGGKAISPQYGQKEIDRITAAVSILKLQGRYNIAKEYQSDYTFLDANTVPWAEGGNVLAYIKATKMFFGNDKGEFMPFDKISEKEYYKILLEALGYKQTTDKAPGDFNWDDVLEFARGKGINPTGTHRFTADHMAKAIIAALKAKTKDGRVYADYLIEEGKIDKAKAVSLGIYVDRLAKVKSANAIGNKVVEVIFESGNTREMVLDKTNYSIDSMEISSVLFIDEKTVHLKTSAQQKYKSYTLKIGEQSTRFTGIAKVNGEPYITSLKCKNENTIVMNFSRVLDYSSASKIDNYKILGIDILDIKVSGRSVTLTTSKLTLNRLYNLRVSNIKSIDNISTERETNHFSYEVDTIQPTVLKVKAETNQRIVVYFSETVEKASAENVNNYTIKNLKGELKILKAELFGSKKDGVRLTTEQQESSLRYEITIGNISDAAKVPNMMRKPVTIAFYGIREDTKPPQFITSEAEIISRNQIRLVFTDVSNFDEASILNVQNYMVTENNRDKDIVDVKKVQKDSYSAGKYKVLLTVDDLKPRSVYRIGIFDIRDEFGNSYNKDSAVTLRMSSKLAVPAAIKSYSAIDSSKVQFTFSKALSKDSAEDVNNYLIRGDIGTPYNATYRYNRVTLEMDELEEARQYVLVVDGLEDAVGNVLKFSYVFKSKEFPPEVVDISQIDERSFEIIMSEDVADITSDGKVYAGGKAFSIKIDKHDKAIVMLTTDSDIQYDKEYSFDISKVLADNSGVKARNSKGSKTILYGELDDYADTDKPYIANVVAVSETIVEVEYNEDIGYEGSYSIYYYEDENTLKSLNIEKCEIKGSLVIITLDPDTPLEDNYSYDLIVKTPAKDLSSNISSDIAGEVFQVDR